MQSFSLHNGFTTFLFLFLSLLYSAFPVFDWTVNLNVKQSSTSPITEPQWRSERSGNFVLNQRSTLTLQGEAALLEQKKENRWKEWSMSMSLLLWWVFFNIRILVTVEANLGPPPLAQTAHQNLSDCSWGARKVLSLVKNVKNWSKKSSERRNWI